MCFQKVICWVIYELQFYDSGKINLFAVSWLHKFHKAKVIATWEQILIRCLSDFQLYLILYKWIYLEYDSTTSILSLLSYNFPLLLTRKIRYREMSILFLVPVGLELGYLLTPKNLNSFSEFMSPLTNFMVLLYF